MEQDQEHRRALVFGAVLVGVVLLLLVALTVFLMVAGPD